MTVTYIQHVHTAGKVGAFLRLLTIWRGGVFKGIWRDLLIFCFLYGAISVVYRFGLSQDETIKLRFERVCVHFDNYGDYIPLGFILGFYVTQVVNRWWLQFTAIPWPDTIALNLISYLPGTRQEKKIRRHVVRLANLSTILALRRISSGVARRFPTYDHFVEAGLMTERELSKLEKMHETTENIHQITWYPIQWAQATLTQAREKGLIKSDFFFSILQENLNDITAKNGSLLIYAWVNIPLVYTQLVTIAVHVYFLSLYLEGSTSAPPCILLPLVTMYLSRQELRMPSILQAMMILFWTFISLSSLSCSSSSILAGSRWQKF